MITIDLPSLQSIQLGHAAIDGRDNNDTCSLKMRSRREIVKNVKKRPSKSNIHH